jgi:hypothetical protein
MAVTENATVSTLGVAEKESTTPSQPEINLEVDPGQLNGSKFIIAERPMTALALSEAESLRQRAPIVSNGPLVAMNNVMMRGVSALGFIDHILTDGALARAANLDIPVGVSIHHVNYMERYCRQLRETSGSNSNLHDFLESAEGAAFELARCGRRLHQVLRHAKQAPETSLDQDLQGSGIDPRVQRWIHIASLRAERGAGKLLAVFHAFQQAHSTPQTSIG